MEIKNFMKGVPAETVRVSTGGRATLIRHAGAISRLSNPLEVEITYTSGDLISVGMYMLRRTIAENPESVVRELAAYRLGSKSEVTQEEFDKLVAEARESGYLI